MYQDILMKLSQQQHVPGLNGASMPPRTPPNAASLMAAAATGNHNLLQNNQNSMHLVSLKKSEFYQRITWILASTAERSC